MILATQVGLTIQKHVILQDINLKVERGTIHGLIGRNGSGKTMLMKCICGFIKPTAGQIVVDGEVVGETRDFPENMGIIIETPGFLNAKSGFQNLKHLAELNRTIDTARITECMEMVGLDPKSRLAVGKYSLGMRQRLGLAQAIMEHPKLLVLDEPFNGLDLEGVADMRRYLLQLRDEGVTMLISSHHAEDITILCDEVLQLDKGRVLEK